MSLPDQTKGFCFRVNAAGQFQRCKRAKLISGLRQWKRRGEYYVLFEVKLRSKVFTYVRVPIGVFDFQNMGPYVYLNGFRSSEHAHIGSNLDVVHNLTAGTETLLEIFERSGIFKKAESAGEL